MATLFKTSGEKILVTPENGKFTLEEMQKYVGGYIEIINVGKNDLMIMNEEGKLMSLPVNEKATEIYTENYGFYDVIVGDVLVTDKNELE